MEKYGDDGFQVIAFPCNQFGGQAPGSSEEERAFAIKKFGIQSLPVMVRNSLQMSKRKTCSLSAGHARSSSLRSCAPY